MALYLGDGRKQRINTFFTNIVKGGSVEYTSIVYNEDNTITLVDTDGVIHIMSCAYEGNKLISITYDGKVIWLTYNDDKLVNVGKTNVDLDNAYDNGYREEIPKMAEHLSMATIEQGEISAITSVVVKESV